MKRVLFTLVTLLLPIKTLGHSNHVHEKFEQKLKLPENAKKILYTYPIESVAQMVSESEGLNAKASTEIALARSTGDVSHYTKAKGYAARSNSETPNVSARLILSEVAQADHKFKEALEWISDIQGNPTASTLRIRIYLGMGEIEKAEMEARQLREHFPFMSSIVYEALVLEAKKDYEKAMKTYYKALEAEDLGQPLQSAWVRSLMARLYLKNGQTKIAKTCIREALRIIPTYPLAQELGKLYF